MPFTWKISNAWCLRYNEHSAVVFRPTYNNFTLTTIRGVIQVADGEATLNCPANTTGIYAEFVNGLPRKIRHINCLRDGKPWLYFTDFGSTCQD